jgi:hypothetical protein
VRTLLLVIGLLLAGCTVARRPSRVVPPSDPCGNVQLVNPPEFPSQEPLWKAGIKAARKRCGELYPYSPCLKKFIRVKVNTYRVICGAKEESSAFETRE